jgi:uncharacterized membrane protein
VPGGHWVVWTVVAVCALTLVGAWLLKGQCLEPWQDYHQYSSLCYNDIQPLWTVRGVADRTFPYIHGALVDGELQNGAIEYPVLTGVFMWVSGAGSDSSNEYLAHSALLLAPFGLLIAHWLVRLRGMRALMWAAAPAVVLYAFHNWDLLVVAAAMVGFWFWMRERRYAAALCFGIGAALKLYPLLFVIPLSLQPAAEGDRKEAGRLLGVGVGALAAINLPFALFNFEGWFATFEFHRLRGPNFDNMWALRELGPLTLPALEPSRLNLVTLVLTAAFFLVALVVGWRAFRRTGSWPYLEVCAALLCAFLLWNKVHSPQYALWLVPFFVLVPVHVGWWVAYSIVDVAVYVGVFRFFYEACSANACQILAEPTVSQRVMTAAVALRAGLLLVLFIVFLRRSFRDVGHLRPSVSHRTPKVTGGDESNARSSVPAR